MNSPRDLEIATSDLLQRLLEEDRKPAGRSRQEMYGVAIQIAMEVGWATAFTELFQSQFGSDVSGLVAATDQFLRPRQRAHFRAAAERTLLEAALSHFEAQAKTEM